MPLARGIGWSCSGRAQAPGSRRRRPPPRHGRSVVPRSSLPLTAEPLEVTTGDGRAGLPPLAVLALPGAPGVTVVMAGTAGRVWLGEVADGGGHAADEGRSGPGRRPALTALLPVVPGHTRGCRAECR